MNSESNLAKKASRSALWLYGQKIILIFFGLFATAIVARRLSPAEYGLVALATAILYFGLLDGRRSIGNFVIYDREEGREERAQAAFWVNIGMALVSVTLYGLAMPVIQYFYKEPLLPLVIAACLLRYVIEQLSTVPEALIRRDIDYYKLVIRDSVLQLVATGLSVLMAVTGWGVWSLVLPYLFIAPVQAGLVMWMSHWRPGFSLHRKYWRAIMSYVTPLIGSNLLGIINTNSDNFLVGTFLGTDSLGIYDRAWRTSNLATDNIVAIVSDISMPFLSSLKDQKERLREAYERILRMLGITTFPVLIGLFVMAEEFILTLYGPKWLAAVLPLRILIIFTLRRAIGSPSGVVFNALGRTNLGLKLNLIGTPIFVIAVVIGCRFGIVGVAIGAMLVKTAWGFVGMHYAGKLIGLPLSKMLKDEWPAFKASLLMALIVFPARWALVAIGVGPVFVLLLCSLLGGGVYLLLLTTRYPELLREVLLFLERLAPSISRTLSLRLLAKPLHDLPVD